MGSRDFARQTEVNMRLPDGIDQNVSDLDLVRAAIKFRDEARNEEAHRTFLFVIDRNPLMTAAYYELAFLYRLEGNHVLAAQVLKKAHEIAPLNTRVSAFLAHMLIAAGDRQAANAVVNSCFVTDAGAWSELQALHQFGDYLGSFSLGKARLMLGELMAKRKYLSSLEVSEKILSALRNKSPFSLIRLGDGEGGCIKLNPGDEVRFSELYRRNRRELVTMWFGPSFDYEVNGFEALSQKIVEAALRSDIVGIPYESWLQHEYCISSVRGIPSLVNVYRALAIAFVAKWEYPYLCSQQVHMELNQQDQLGPILREADEVALIAWNPELPGRIQKYFGISHVVFYRIPGESGSGHILGPEMTRGAHYPDAFEKMCNILSVPQAGKLVLIAAGILGKFYADVVKQNGGVAVDIGSLADGWSGKFTRPGMQRDLDLNKN